MSVAIEDILNQGLRASGVPLRIETIYEGSDQAKIALEIYGQTRDEMISEKDWSFSRRIVSLTLLKGPPPANGYNAMTPWTSIYPIPGFLYEYAYPDDMVSLRAIISPPGFMPDVDPLPALWRIDNDTVPVVSGNPPVASGPPARVILANTTDAIAVYRAQVTDPNQWDTDFTEALVASLAKKFAVAFGVPADQAKELTTESAVTTQVASAQRG